MRSQGCGRASRGLLEREGESASGDSVGCAGGCGECAGDGFAGADGARTSVIVTSGGGQVVGWSRGRTVGQCVLDDQHPGRACSRSHGIILGRLVAVSQIRRAYEYQRESAG
jgi:hypothetical protein